MTGRTPSQILSAPPLPPLAAHLWRYFIDLSLTRSTGGMALSRLSRLEIRAWEEDEGVQLEGWERRAILRLDAAYVASNGPKKPGGSASDGEDD
jgi:hypothetical protein